MKNAMKVCITIDSGVSLLKYLTMRDLNVVSWSGLYSAQNCIFLPDQTSFNWKSRDGVVRVNCQKQARDAIESGTDLRMMPNGAGDPTRPYSLLLGNQRELDAVIEALRAIEGNKARAYGSRTAGKQEEAGAEIL